MSNFDLKKFLVENKLTENSKQLATQKLLEEVKVKYVGSKQDNLKGKEGTIISSEPDGVFLKADDGSKGFVPFNDITDLKGNKVTYDTLGDLAQDLVSKDNDLKAKKAKEREITKAKEKEERERKKKEKLDADAPNREKAEKERAAQGARVYPELKGDEDAVVRKIVEETKKHATEYVEEQGSEPYPEQLLNNKILEVVESENSFYEALYDHEQLGQLLEDIVEDVDSGKSLLSSDFNLFNSIEHILTYGYYEASIADYLTKAGWKLISKDWSDDTETWDTEVIERNGETMTINEIWTNLFSGLDTVHRETFYDDYPYGVLDKMPEN